MNELTVLPIDANLTKVTAAVKPYWIIIITARSGKCNNCRRSGSYTRSRPRDCAEKKKSRTHQFERLKTLIS
jgi:hypothetical protein